MANSPVQVVLNSSDFINTHEKSGGGQNKDFYAGNDVDFVQHKSALIKQLESLKTKQLASDYTEISYAKLNLKQSALAKTHRPTSKLFTKEIAPVVGGGDLGELFVKLNPDAIEKLKRKIDQAEEITRWKVLENGKEVPNPSQLRSEVGAIEDITSYLPKDKRRFTLQDGIEWLSRPQTGGAYIVELFQTPPPRQEWDTLSTEEFSLFQTFLDGLSKLGNGTVAMRLIDSNKNTSMIGVKLEESDLSPNIQFLPTTSSLRRQPTLKKINTDIEKHSVLINFLENHPLVKRILLPPIVTKSNDKVTFRPRPVFTIPTKATGRKYPKICIVDGGVSSNLNSWIEDSWNYISPSDKDEEHGTFIAGLLVVGNNLNGPDICCEEDGCEIIDLDLLPKPSSYELYYANRPLAFFEELKLAVTELKARTGVRVFNFSLNVDEHVSNDEYSLPAQLLDAIAEENDVIFVISAGNTTPPSTRQEWPENPIEALSILANSRNDTIKTPAESSRNLSVAALNPPSMIGVVPHALSNYSCRGPGMRVGLKPDLAHVGGSGTKIGGWGHGLSSIDSNSSVLDGCGTSYAAPLVAKTLACIENAVEGNISRETLMGLMLHHASLPRVLADKRFNDVAKHLVGYGIPNSATTILEGSEEAITLVFANRIGSGLRMSFDFSWPQILVKNEKCYGKARLTVISTPPFDYSYGSEFVRINVDGHLRQRQNDGSYKGRLDPVYLPSPTKNTKHEKNLIDYSMKWSPIKVYEKEFRGTGPSTDWRLDVEYLTRAGEVTPFNGIPFTALLTISDPKGKEPVFQNMRQSLQALGVQIVDIKTATRVTPRV